MIIYKTICAVNWLIYVGHHECGPDCLNKKGKCTYFGSGSKFKREALRVYPKGAFRRETLEVIVDNITTASRETYWIDKLDATNPLIGYNVANKGTGVSGGWKQTAESRAKISRKVKKKCEDPNHRKKDK